MTVNPTQPEFSVSNIASEECGFCPSTTIALAELKQANHQQTPFNVIGVGAHHDQRIAVRIAVSELAERYAVVTVPWERISRCSFSNGAACVDPQQLQQLSAKRARSFGLAPFHDHHPYYWIDGVEVISGRTVNILADFCFAYRPNNYSHRYAWATSSGMACAQTSSMTERSALLELYERDALMVTWMSRWQPPHVPRKKLSDQAQNVIENISRHGYSCYSLDATCKTIPVAMAVAHRNKWPALVMGMAARASLDEAMTAAWREAEVELFLRFREEAHNEPKVKLRPKSVITPDDHALFYNHPANSQYAAFLWKNRQETKQDTEATVDGIGDDGAVFDLADFASQQKLEKIYRVAYDDVLGLKVVRILSPQLVPLLFGWNQFPDCSLLGAGLQWPGTSIPPHPLT